MDGATDVGVADAGAFGFARGSSVIAISDISERGIWMVPTM